MKKNWFIIGLLVALGACIFFLLQPDKDHDTNTPGHSQALANDDSVKAHKGQFLYIIDSLNKDKRQLIAENNSLKERLAIYEEKINAKSAQVKTLADQVKAANKDTALNAKIDSLVNEVNNLNLFLVQYEIYADSLNRANAALQSNCDAGNIEKDKRIAELQTAYDSLFKAYQQLFADSNSLRKDLKRQKLKTKVVAVLAGAAAVLGLIK